jgi:hypothetical protein
MACPFFMPVVRLENGIWLHAERLPLGGGWSGQCTAPGHEGETPSHDDLRELCNLGYADGCGRLPRERVWDSVRFAVKRVGNDSENGTGGRILIRYVCERGHRPIESGTLALDASEARWVKPHRDSRVQRMAECFLESYMEKTKRQEVTRAAS